MSDRPVGVVRRASRCARRTFTLQNGQERLGIWPHVMIAAVAVPLAIFMVLIGNRLLGLSLLRLTGPKYLVQFAAGFSWLFVASGLAFCSSRARRSALRAGMKLGCVLMLGLAFLVVPIGGHFRARGAGEYAPNIVRGLILGLPASILIWWLIPLLVRRRRGTRAWCTSRGWRKSTWR